MESLLEQLKDYYLDKCSKNTPYHKVYIMKHIKNNKKKIIDITLYDLDEVLIKKEQKHKYIVKITDDPSPTEIAKYSKYERKYIPVIEDAYLYNNYFREIDQKKHDNNKYIENYRKTLNHIYELYGQSKKDHEYFNLFEKVLYDTIYKYNDESEIDDWLKIMKNKKLSLCHNYFWNNKKLYHLLILPDISRGIYDNTDNLFDPYTNLYEMNITNDGRNQMDISFSKNLSLDYSIHNEDMETLYRFINRKYLLQPNKGIQIKYTLFILGANKEDDIINLRDINTQHNPLLEHIYQLSSFFMYNLYSVTTRNINITTRNPTDTYGILYFKINNYTSYNHYTYREGVYEKEHNLFAIIENNKIPNYYAKNTFEYQIEYYQYLNIYKEKLDSYKNDKNNNITFINILELALSRLEDIKDRTLLNCYKKKYKLCDRSVISNDKTKDKYLEELNNHNNRYVSPKKSNINYKYSKLQDEIKNTKIIRFYDNAYKMYSIIMPNKILKLTPKFYCDNYIDLLVRMKLKKFIKNNDYTVYHGFVNTNDLYSDVYKIVQCSLPDIKSLNINPDKCITLPNKQIGNYDINNINELNKLFSSPVRTKIIYNKQITDQIQYHFDYVTKNKISTSHISTVPSFLQLIYLGLNENMLKFNMNENVYIFNNGKFIICPDPKWVDGLSLDIIQNITNIYDKSNKLPQIHYTAWYNPYQDNIIKTNFSLWEDAIISNNKKEINPATFKKIMDLVTSRNNDMQYNIFRNIHKAYKNGWFDNGNIKDKILEYYKNEENLDPIFRKEHSQYFLNLIDPKVLGLDNWDENIQLFIQNNELLRDKKLISYIHKGIDPLTMSFHIHLIFEPLKYEDDGGINIRDYEQRFTSENTRDVFYNLKLNPNYYRTNNHTLLSKIMYSTFYVNITDHIDPLLFDYPLYPTFNLKIFKLNNKNIIYPNIHALDNKLGFNYDQFTEEKKSKYIDYINKYHDNIENTEPFTFDDWILNKKITSIYQTKNDLLLKFKYIENFDSYTNYIDRMWDQNDTIREFYKNFINHYKKINNVM
ncbi:hypothetical protein Indivirus_4_11 [Indivirus ILV1]|uniref:Uncharacterized protein n=1 Tax=Indivirus ILV1 TaxID=1977633 RepID=A0A1V0SDP2_9VIRU|nr:hypothetical protein Indivirus_4_11 [Indivirus ILV1]